MVRRSHAVLWSLLAASTVQAQAGLSGSRPNIVFVFSDDHAAHAISAYGSKINQTPGIDRLAAGGVLFTNTFCGNSICGPSRATVLTGKHCHAHGFMRNGNTFDGAQTTFPKLLQTVGYQTAVIGKWHLGSDPTGFDHWMVLPDQGEYYNPDFLTKDGRVRIEGHATEITTDLAIRWLEQRDEKRPFLLMCQHKAPHRNWMPAAQDLGLYRDADVPEPATLFDDYAGRTPAAQHQEMSIAKNFYLHYDLLVPPTAAEHERLQGPDRSWDVMRKRMTDAQRATWDAAYAAENEAFRREDPQGKERVRWQYQRYIKNYLRCVAGVDRSVATLLDWLDAHPAVKANTIVVYSSDQGFYLGDHGWYDKRWMYEESFRMPLLVQWPGRIAAGKQVTQLAQNIDYAPTFLDLAGVPLPADLHGTSLVPLLAGAPPAAWRDAIYYHFYESQAVHMVPAHYGVRTERWKLIRYYEPQWNAWELFDLQADADEVHDLAGDPAFAEVRAALTKQLDGLRRRYGDETGRVGDGAFALTAGIARAEHDERGWRIWANASGGYLLQSGERTGTTTFTTTLTSVAGRQQRNGFVVVSGGEPRRELVRAGIEFGARRLSITGVEGGKAKVSEPIEWDGKAAVELLVTVDLTAHRIVAAALGQRIEAPLPEGWTRLTQWGFGASNAETVFSDLVVR
ncbi:MAG: sulfatase [Planctomycetota bacterium]|nr:sulfatase [Planctomycetota bacterium]